MDEGMGMACSVRLLGDLEIRADGARLELGGLKQQAVLGSLLLRVNQSVRIEQLKEDVWAGEEARRPVDVADNTVQKYVDRLRGVLRETPIQIQTGPRSYSLTADVELLDSHTFERDAVGGMTFLQQADYENASTHLDSALRTWQGELLADLPPFPQLSTERERLNVLRQSAEEAYLTAQVHLGRHGIVLGRLKALVHEDLERETLVGLLMISLYRLGRQGEALEAFARTREALADAGLEVSRELEELQKRVLTQDPGLDVAREPKKAPAAHPELIETDRIQVRFLVDETEDVEPDRAGSWDYHVRVAAAAPGRTEQLLAVRFLAEATIADAMAAILNLLLFDTARTGHFAVFSVRRHRELIASNSLVEAGIADGDRLWILPKDDLASQVIAREQAEQRAQADLRVVGGPLMGRSVPLPRGRFLIGRDPDADVVLPDGSMSRVHLAIAVGDDEITVADEESTNGTYVSGKRLKQTYSLRSREIVEAGNTLLQVVRRVTSSGPMGSGTTPSAEAATAGSDVHPDAFGLRHAVRSGLNAKRRSGDDDFLRVRIGWGNVFSLAPEAGLREPGDREGPADAAPVVLRLADFGVVVVRGASAACMRFGRWIATQLTCLHDPDEVFVAVVGTSEELREWAWLALYANATCAVSFEKAERVRRSRQGATHDTSGHLIQLEVGRPQATSAASAPASAGLTRILLASDGDVPRPHAVAEIEERTDAILVREEDKLRAHGWAVDGISREVAIDIACEAAAIHGRPKNPALYDSTLRRPRGS